MEDVSRDCKTVAFLKMLNEMAGADEFALASRTSYVLICGVGLDILSVLFADGYVRIASPAGDVSSDHRSS